MNNPLDLLNQLSPSDAHNILRQLAARDETLAAQIAAMILARLSDVDIDELAESLRDDLESLTPEDVWERSGNTRYGFVETGEAADALIRELLEPYMKELQQAQNTGLTLAAEQMCLGLLLGFYLFEYEVEQEFKDWASDAPLGFAHFVAHTWRAGLSYDYDVSAVLTFIDKELPRWASSLRPLIDGERTK